MDWTHEREWRCPDDLALQHIGFYVIVWSADEASEVVKLNVPNVLGVLPMENIGDML